MAGSTFPMARVLRVEARREAFRAGIGWPLQPLSRPLRLYGKTIHRPTPGQGKAEGKTPFGEGSIPSP